MEQKTEKYTLILISISQSWYMNTDITNNDYSRQDKLSCIKLKFYFHRHTFSHNASVKCIAPVRKSSCQKGL